VLEAEDTVARPAAPDPSAPPGREKFARAALLGSLVALVPFVWMLSGPGPSLVSDEGLLGSFFDVQGHALLDGRLDVPPEEVSFEGFRVDGRTYTYFGLVPSLLRLPVLAVTDDLDGQLTQLSMLLAFAVLLAGGAVLHWRVRCLLRPGRPLARTDSAAAFLLQVVLGAGAVPLYLASRPVVYHEAELWGAALAVAAIAAIVGIVARPQTRPIVWAGLLTALAVNARFSVGLGPVLALGLLAAAVAMRVWVTPRGGRIAEAVASFAPRGSDGAGGPTVALLVGAATLPLALHAAVNAAKFDQPFGIPIDKQVASQIEPGRRAALADNDGTIFGLKFVPTTLVQAARPDAVGLIRAFPFVGLPSEPAAVIGDVTFDTIQPSLSAPTSMPALFLLTLVGVVALVRRRLWPLLGVLAGMAGGFAVTLTIAFVTTRYLADLLPFLLLGGIVGMHVLLAGTRRSGTVLGAVGVLALAGLVVNGATGLAGQRLLYPDATEPERADFVRFQDDVDQLLDRRPSGVDSGSELPLPARGAPGDLFLLDRCAGLYVQGLEKTWLPVERTPRSGVHRLRVRFPRTRDARAEALLSLGSGPRRVAVTSRATQDGAVLAVTVGRRTEGTSRPVAVTGPARVDVSIDPLYGAWFAAIRVDGEEVLSGARTPYVRRARATLGADPRGLPRFSGEVERVAARPEVCREIAERAGLAR
jgi:hypothetical protein